MPRIHKNLFYWLLVLIPCQLGKHFWPQWAYILGRRIDYLSPTLYITDLLTISILFFWFIDGYKTRKIGFSKYIRLIFPVVGLLLIEILSWIGKIDISVEIWKLVYLSLKTWEYGLLLLYIYINRPEFIKVVISLVVGAIAVSVLAIIQFIGGSSVGGWLWIFGERNFNIDTPGIAVINICILNRGCFEAIRGYATFPHPNVLGGYLAAILPLFLFSKNIHFFKNKYTFLILSVLMTTGLIVTFSRSALAAAVVVTSGLLVLYKPKKKSCIFAGVFLGAVFLMLVFTRFFIGASESVDDRLNLSISAVNMMRLNPLTGVGFGYFLNNLPQFLEIKKIYFIQPVHSIYLLALAETGLIGSLIFILIGAWYLNLVKQKIFNSNYTITFIPLLVFLLIGFLDHYPITLHQGLLSLTIFLGLPFTNFKKGS